MPKPFISSAGLSSSKESRLMSKKKLSTLLAAIAEWFSFGAIIAVPLIYLVHTGQSQDFIKQIVLLVFVSIAALCWVGSMLVNKTLSLRRTVANPVVLVLLVTIFISALASSARYVGLVGGNGQEYQSFMTTLLFVAYFFVVINIPQGRKFGTRALFASIVVGGLVSLIALIQYAGGKVIPGVDSAAFNLIGSTVVLGTYAAVTVVMAAASFLMEMPEGKITFVKRIVIGFFGLCALALTVVIDFWLVWTAVIIGLLFILIFAVVRPQAIRRLGWLAVPMIALVISVLLLVVNIPLPIRAPVEVYPSLPQSLAVARGSLVSHPIFGAGPGTYNQEFALHRMTELNQTSLWYVQFDRGISYLTTLASTLGVAGLVAWLAVFAIGIWKSIVHLFVTKKKDDDERVFALVIVSAWLVSAAGIILYGASLSALLLFWLLFAILIRAASTANVEVSFESSPRSGLVMTFAFVILIVLSFSGWFVSATRFYADSSLAAASAMDINTESDAIIANLENALRADPQSDMVARNLSQAYLIKIQQLFNDKDMDSAERSTQVKDLTSAAIKAATLATTLGPKNIQNWSQLGATYENVSSFVASTTEQAIVAYQRAIDMDPNSPVHPTAIGRVYLAVAGQNLAIASTAKDEAAQTEAKKKADDAVISAIASLEKALKLKSDYGPASYQIALAYDAQGKTKEAIASLENILLANQADAGVEFEIASLYYRDGQKEKAQGVLENLVKTTPSFANARWLLAIIYEEGQEFDKAIAQVEEILKANPDNQDVKDKLQALQDAKAGKTAENADAAPPALP